MFFIESSTLSAVYVGSQELRERTSMIKTIEVSCFLICLNIIRIFYIVVLQKNCELRITNSRSALFVSDSSLVPSGKFAIHKFAIHLFFFFSRFFESIIFFLLRLFFFFLLLYRTWISNSMFSKNSFYFIVFEFLTR